MLRSLFCSVHYCGVHSCGIHFVRSIVAGSIFAMSILQGPWLRDLLCWILKHIMFLHRWEDFS